MGVENPVGKYIYFNLTNVYVMPIKDKGKVQLASGNLDTGVIPFHPNFYFCTKK
jgi:hypothetical protein